jgi:hypothetical protein
MVKGSNPQTFLRNIIETYQTDSRDITVLAIVLTIAAFRLLINFGLFPNPIELPKEKIGPELNRFNDWATDCHNLCALRRE